MSEVLKIKSRAITVYDFDKADITEFVKGFTVDEEQYNKDLARVLKRYGAKAEAETVSDGDTVTLTCVSELSRFNKADVPVVVGKGVFDAGIEAELVGMNRGETKLFDKDGTEVSVTVLKIVHTTLPELTDANVASFGMEGVTTVRELRKSLVAKQIDGFILEDENADMASAYVWREVAMKSEVERDPEEYEFIRAKAEKKVAEVSQRFENEPDEETDPDDEEEGGSVMNTEALINMFVAELDLAAIGAGMMEKAGRCLTMDDYSAYIDKLAEAYPEKARETIEKEHPALEYAVENYANYLAGLIDRYVADRFKAILTEDI
jgi:hypothetical protein